MAAMKPPWNSDSDDEDPVDGAKGSPRYTTNETTGGRRKTLKRAAGHEQRNDENIAGHVGHETMASLRATQYGRLPIGPRRFRRTAQRAIRRQHRWDAAATTDLLKLREARAFESHVRRLLADLRPRLGAPTRRSLKVKLAMKALVVLGEMMIVSAALTTLVRLPVGRAVISSIGLSLALIALPTLGSMVAKTHQARKLFNNSVAGAVAPRIVRDHYNKSRTTSRFRLWIPAGIYIAAITTIAATIGLLISRDASIPNPGAKGLATAIILVVTGIGVAVIEFRLTSVEGELLRNLEDDLNGYSKDVRRLDRSRRGPIRRVAKAEADLLLLDVSVGSDFRARNHGASSEIVAAGGELDERAAEMSTDDHQRLARFLPRSWVADRPKIDRSIEIDEELEVELKRQRDHLLADVLIETGQEAESEAGAGNGHQPGADPVSMTTARQPSIDLAQS